MKSGASADMSTGKWKANINYINNSYLLCVHGFGVIC